MPRKSKQQLEHDFVLLGGGAVKPEGKRFRPYRNGQPLGPARASESEAFADVYRDIASDVMGANNLSSSAWERLGASGQHALAVTFFHS